MSKKIDERLPQGFGLKAFPGEASIKSPWEKLYGFRDTLYYILRYDCVVGAQMMQAFRIALPDYMKRTDLLCDVSVESCTSSMGYSCEMVHAHPFFKGDFLGALSADLEEYSLLPGRVNDFGTYRIEKELDVCPWDITGSELCRSTVYGMEWGCKACASNYRPGPELELHMVEAMGCGDRHCRVVGESREKWPMPKKPEKWDHFGPIATANLVKFTPDEECYKLNKMFREEMDYRYANGTNAELDYSAIPYSATFPATDWIIPAAMKAVEKGLMKEEDFDRAIKCVCEAAGKTAFGEFFAKEGLRGWLGVPKEIGDDDGRVLGAYIEMYMQGKMLMRGKGAKYEVEAFNKDEVIYVADRDAVSSGQPKYLDALLAYWYGMSKTLINTQWALWEEDSPEGKVRIKIAKKIDKWC
jgi:hypothetical protein